MGRKSSICEPLFLFSLFILLKMQVDIEVDPSKLKELINKQQTTFQDLR